MPDRSLKSAEVCHQLLRPHRLRSWDVNRGVLQRNTHQLVHGVYSAVLTCQELLVPAVGVQGQQPAEMLRQAVSGEVLSQVSHFYHLNLEK